MPAIVRDLPCSLEELFNGCTKKLAVTRKRPVAETGARRRAGGQVSKSLQASTGGEGVCELWQTTVLTHDADPRPPPRARLLSGELVDETKHLVVMVKPGWKPGTKITFPCEGDAGSNIIPADLVFVIAEKVGAPGSLSLLGGGGGGPRRARAPPAGPAPRPRPPPPPPPPPHLAQGHPLPRDGLLVAGRHHLRAGDGQHTAVEHGHVHTAVRQGVGERELHGEYEVGALARELGVGLRRAQRRQ